MSFEAESPRAEIVPVKAESTDWVAPSVAPDRAAAAMLEGVPHSEMETIHLRLGRLCRADEKGNWFVKAWRRIEWDRFFGAATVLFLGAAVGAALGLVPLLNIENDAGERGISDRALGEYVAGMLAAGAVGLLCGLARMAIKAEREDSIRNIHHDFGKILNRYEEGLKSLGTGTT